MLRRRMLAMGVMALLSGWPVTGWSAEPLSSACRQSIAPQRCELMRQGQLSCSDLPLEHQRECRQLFTPQLNCSRSRDARSCQALQQAQQACDAQQGEARRICIRERLPAPDCSRAAAPERCRQRVEAEQACGGRYGADYRECVAKAMR
ncbi:MAG: hypothetical protein HYZ18_09405 [Pseudogulbenkiania sp.]|nr:hypothetical protein [Pseudogulbenkiania sp.]